jgi:hypothetical protein
MEENVCETWWYFTECYYVYGIYYISTEFFKYLNIETVYLFMLSGHMSTQMSG